MKECSRQTKAVFALILFAAIVDSDVQVILIYIAIIWQEQNLNIPIKD